MAETATKAGTPPAREETRSAAKHFARGLGSLSPQGFALAAATALSLSTAGPAGAGQGCEGKYVVQQGDTLSAIASRCDSTVRAIRGANPQITSRSVLSIVWQLAIPGAAEAGAGGMSSMSSMSEAAEAALGPQGPMTLQGWIVNGPRCAMIETENGEAYGIVSPEFSFHSGRLVKVVGRLVDDPSCRGPRTLLVTDLAAISL